MENKNIIQRLLCAVLLVCMILSSLVACGNGKEKSEDTSVSETGGENDSGSAKENALPDLPAVNYEGYKFRILNATQESLKHMNLQLTAQEEASGDALNDAIYQRNSIISERYGIEIVETQLEGVTPILDMAKKSISAGLDEFDLIMNDTVRGIPLAQQGMLTDFHTVPHIDMTKPYYDQNMVKDNSIANKLFFLGGDFSLSHDSSTIAMFFNKKLIADYGLTAPYQLVREGKWTFKEFFEMAKVCTDDLDGNGAYDENDRYGYLSLNFVAFPALIESAGLKYVTKNENDIPSLAINNEKFFNVYSTLIDSMYYGNMFFDADAAGNHRLQDVMFPANQALFWTELLNWSSILREMDADFGILPHPKYDETQSDYHVLVFNPFFMMIPQTNQNLDRTGVIIEALCAESYQSVKPVYYDTMLKTKVSRDDESGDMLDIMFANRTYELAQLYWGSEIFDTFNDNLSKKRNPNVTSFLERYETKINTAIDKTVSVFEAMK